MLYVSLPCLLKVDTLLRMEVPTTLPPWRVRPQHCGLFRRTLMSGLVIAVGFGGCLSESGPESTMWGIRRA